MIEWILIGLSALLVVGKTTVAIVGIVTGREW